MMWVNESLILELGPLVLSNEDYSLQRKSSTDAPIKSKEDGIWRKQAQGFSKITALI